MLAVLIRVRRATKKRVTATDEWRASIRAARDQGATLRAIADAAGVSHVRVLKILRGE